MPSADHFLQRISKSQWQEWLEWINIRGPIGPAREDFYWPQLLLRTGAPYEKQPKLSDMYPPWLRPGEVSTLAFVRPWVSDGDEEDEQDDEGHDEN